MIGVFGDLTLDIAAATHGPLQPRSDVTGDISCRGGGSAANVAAWLGSLGTPVRFAGAIGRDEVGRNLAAELECLGVELYLAEKDSPTGMILVFLDTEGERTMVTSRGANLLFRAEDLPDQFFAGLQHLHITGYSFFGSESLAASTAAVLGKARELGIPFSVDPSSYALLEDFGVERFLEFTQGAALVFPNLDEGRVLSGQLEPENVVRQLLQYYPRVVLTLGSQGCICGEGEAVEAVPGQKAQALDTTGAGDAFCAGFLHEFFQGAGLVASAQTGNEIARRCVSHLGGRPLHAG